MATASSAIPFFCSDCEAELKPGHTVRKKDGRVICDDCERRLQKQKQDRAQGDLFVEQSSLFNPKRRRNVEGYRDEAGTFHPIRESKDYNEFLAGDFEPKKPTAKQARQVADWERKELEQLREDTIISGGPSKTLAQFVRSMGGIVPTPMFAGEIRRLGYKETGTTGLINQKARQGSAKQTAEYVMDAANVEGYRDRYGERFTSIGDFLRAVEDSAVKGIDHYRARGATAKQRRDKAMRKATKNPKRQISAQIHKPFTIYFWHPSDTGFGRFQDYGIYRARNKTQAVSHAKSAFVNQFGEKNIKGLKFAAVPVTKKNPGIFGSEARASAKQVTRIRPVKEKGTNERGHIVGAGPQGWLKVKWDNRAKPTLIKRSELKLARGLKSLKNPIAIQRCSSCGQTFGQTTECPMCQAGIGRAARRNPKQRGGTAQRDRFIYRGFVIQYNPFRGTWFISKGGFKYSGEYKTIEAAKEVIDEMAPLDNPKPSRARVIAATKGALRGAQTLQDFGAISSATQHKRQQELKARHKRARTPTVGPKGKLPNPDGDVHIDAGHVTVIGKAKRVRTKNPKTGSRDAFGVWHPNPSEYSKGFGKKKWGELFTTGRAAILEAKDYFNRTWPNTDTERKALKGLVSAYEYAGFSHARATAAAERELKKKHKAKNPAKGSSIYDEDVKKLESAIRKVVARAKRDRTVGMSKANIKQLIPSVGGTQGLRISPSVYHAAFDEAFANVAPKIKGFRFMNPSVTAIAEKFQGEANGKLQTLHAANGCPANVARAGKLVFLKVKSPDRHVNTWRLPGCVVCIAPSEKLWIAADHAPIFKTKARPGEGLDLGEVTHICYETAKAHVGGGKTYEYVHEFGEDGGKRPHLIIDHEGMPILRGGDYKIKAEGIVN